MKHLAAVSSVTAIGLLLAAGSPSQDPATASEDWPQWRGPEGTGMAQGDAPTTWSSENVKWRVDIPGRGCSTPVIWGDRIFLTTAVPTGKEPEPEFKTFQSGTFTGNALSMAAGLACLTELEKKDYSHIDSLAEKLRNTIQIDRIDLYMFSFFIFMQSL